jgi:hypothetical protein
LIKKTYSKYSLQFRSTLFNYELAGPPNLDTKSKNVIFDIAMVAQPAGFNANIPNSTIFINKNSIK